MIWNSSSECLTNLQIQTLVSGMDISCKSWSAVWTFPANLGQRYGHFLQNCQHFVLSILIFYATSSGCTQRIFQALPVLCSLSRFPALCAVNLYIVKPLPPFKHLPCLSIYWGLFFPPNTEFMCKGIKIVILSTVPFCLPVRQGKWRCDFIA